jgi:hypothetical protein
MALRVWGPTPRDTTTRRTTGTTSTIESSGGGDRRTAFMLTSRRQHASERRRIVSPMRSGAQAGDGDHPVTARHAMQPETVRHASSRHLIQVKRSQGKACDAAPNQRGREYPE